MHINAAKLFIFWLLYAICEGSVYSVRSSMTSLPFARYEKMFATNNGPLFASEGESSVQMDIQAFNLTSRNSNWRMVVLFFHAHDIKTLQTVEENLDFIACAANEEYRFHGMDHMQRMEFKAVNSTLKFSAKYVVNASGLIDTLLYVCSDAVDSEILPYNGTLTITNPYGLLPAIFYGLMPFSFILAVGYFFLDIFFLIMLCKYRDQVLFLQYTIFSTLIIGTISSLVWFCALYEMNSVGQPFAWPLPSLYVFAVILDVGMRTLARIILLIVCLGYGIVRESIRPLEKIFITILSILYLLSGIADDLARDSSGGINQSRPTGWSFSQLACNLLFVLWIYIALENILNELKAQNQFAKLSMYKSLALSLGSFVLFFTILTVVAVCTRFHIFEWQIDLEWTQLVAWPVLNFIVSMAMCIIWRPTSTSSQFAFSMQLPTSDEAEAEDENCIELTASKNFTTEDMDERDENDEEVEIDLRK